MGMSSVQRARYAGETEVTGSVVFDIAKSVRCKIEQSVAVEILQPAGRCVRPDFAAMRRLTIRVKQDGLLFLHPAQDDRTTGQSIGTLQGLDVLVWEIAAQNMSNVHAMLAKPPYPADKFAVGENALQFVLRPFEELFLRIDVQARLDDAEEIFANANRQTFGCHFLLIDGNAPSDPYFFFYAHGIFQTDWAVTMAFVPASTPFDLPLRKLPRNMKLTYMPFGLYLFLCDIAIQLFYIDCRFRVGSTY
jgi:hypothetical protein